MKTVYICSPFRAATERLFDNHIEYAQELTSKALDAGLAPITPHLYLTQCLDEDDEAEREKGLRAGEALMLTCNALVIGARYGVSEGMKREIAQATLRGIPIVAIADGTSPKEMKELIEEVTSCEALAER